MLAALEKGWQLDKQAVRSLETRPLGTVAEGVRAILEKELLSGVFGIEEPLRRILRRNVEHARAIDALGAVKELDKSDVGIVHVRLLEESYTIAAYLVLDPAKYEEFGWRWKAFPTIHGIRNRIVGLGKPPPDDMMKWVKDNERHLAWFDPKGRLSGDITSEKTREQWEKCSHWLIPASIKDVFEKTGRLDSYRKMGYDMGSQAVHLSPMGDIYMSFEMEHLRYAEFAHESASFSIVKMFSICLDLVNDRNIVRQEHARENLVQTKMLAASNPRRFADLVTRLPSYAAFVQAVMKDPTDTESIIEAVIGKAAASKLELKL